MPDCDGCSKCAAYYANCNRCIDKAEQVYENKRAFVQNELTALVQRIDPDIKRPEYNVDLRRGSRDYLPR